MKLSLSAIVLIASCILASVANAQIRITEVDLANDIIEITNDGGADIDISNWWVCNRVNGSPFYSQVSNAISINNASFEASGVADLTLEAGDVLVLDVAAGFLPDAGGEFAFYNTNSFGSSAAIEDYIAWGGDGIRDSVAQGAGIWTGGNFIDVSGLGGNTIQLGFGETGEQAGDYLFASSTLGSIAVPEPSSLAVVGLIGIAGIMRRRR